MMSRRSAAQATFYAEATQQKLILGLTIRPPVAQKSETPMENLEIVTAPESCNCNNPGTRQPRSLDKGAK